MSIDIYKDKLLGAQLSGIPVLHTPWRIPRADVPRGWYCYDLQGTPRHPDEPSGLVDQAEEYHAGTILSNRRLKKPQTQKKILVRDEFRLSGIQLTLLEFCSRERIQYPQSPIRHTPRPASLDEAGLFYALPPERDEELGAIGHDRIDFGRRGNRFYHSWQPRGPEELNTQDFKDELTEVIDELRQSVLNDLPSMRAYCGSHGGVIQDGWPQQYGYVIDTDRYRYFLRCNPIEGDYQAYLSCFDKQAQEMNQARQRTAKTQDAAEEQPKRSGPLEIRSLADLKRAIKPGAEMVATYHAYHPETVGLVRVVTEVHTNAFYSKVKDQPDHELSTCNHGRGFRTDFEKASCYQFEGPTVKVLNPRKNDGSVLFEFELYAPEMKMDAQEETGESLTMTMGGMS